MRRLFYLLGVVLSIIFSTPFTISTIINISANDYISYASTAQSDLKAFGINENDYPLDLDSNRHVSCFLFAEDIEEENTFYYLYLYDPKGFSVVPVKNFLQIQISHLTSNFVELLDDDTSVERALNYYDLTYMSSSDNGTIAKFLVNGLKFSSPKIYRRYQLRQVSYYYNKTINYYTFGDEFLYETLSDGSISYEWKKMDYITLYNTECASFFTTDESFWSQLYSTWFSSKSQQAFFYGFSFPKGFSIDNLIDISFSYNYSKMKGVSYSPHGSFYIDLLHYDSYLNPKKLDTVSVIDKKIDCEKKFIDGNESSFGLFVKTFNVEFKTISTYKEMIKNNNDSFVSFIANNFVDSDYIICFDIFDYKYDVYDLTNLFLDEAEEKFKLYLTQHNNNKPTTLYYEIEKYDCTNVEVLNLTFNFEGEQYNIDVITAPIDSNGDYHGSGNPTIWDKLLELFYKFRDFLMETFGLDEIWATLLAIVLILVSLFIIFDLVKSLVVKGSTSLILKLGSILFIGLGYLFKGLFTILYYLLIYPFKLIFGG